MHEMNPKVSVIIPIYNTGKYLPECVESVRNQTLKEIEIILVDDESPDNAPVLCDEYAHKDSRIKVVHKKNGGLGYARNSGLDVATGEYISFIDSDDFVLPEMMQTLYETAKGYGADDVRSGTIFYNNGKTTIRQDVDKLTVFRGADEVKKFVFDLLGPLPEEPRDVKYMMSVCLALHKRSVIEENHVRFTSERETLSEDLIFDLDLLPKMNCIVCIPDCFYHYRMNPSSLTHTFSIKKFKTNEEYFRLVKVKMNHYFKSDDYYLHYLRLMSLNIRTWTAGAVRQSKATDLLWNVRQVVNYHIWDDFFTNYPIQRFNIKRCLYFYVLKKKWILGVIILHKFIIK